MEEAILLNGSSRSFSSNKRHWLKKPRVLVVYNAFEFRGKEHSDWIDVDNCNFEIKIEEKMEFSTPKVTIDLEEYKLLKNKSEAFDNLEVVSGLTDDDLSLVIQSILVKNYRGQFANLGPRSHPYQFFFDELSKRKISISSQEQSNKDYPLIIIRKQK